MFPSLAARGAMVVEPPPAVALRPLKGCNGHEGSPTVGVTKDATGELPESRWAEEQSVLRSSVYSTADLPY